VKAETEQRLPAQLGFEKPSPEEAKLSRGNGTQRILTKEKLKVNKKKKGLIRRRPVDWGRREPILNGEKNPQRVWSLRTPTQHDGLGKMETKAATTELCGRWEKKRALR